MKLEILASLERLRELDNDAVVTVGVDSLQGLLEQLLDFESRVQTGTILKDGDGYVILVRYFEICGGVEVSYFGYITQDDNVFYLDRLADEYLEKQPELAGEPVASPTKCAEYILSSGRRLHSFLKWLEEAKL